MPPCHERIQAAAKSQQQNKQAEQCASCQRFLREKQNTRAGSCPAKLEELLQGNIRKPQPEELWQVHVQPGEERTLTGRNLAAQLTVAGGVKSDEHDQQQCSCESRPRSEKKVSEARLKLNWRSVSRRSTHTNGNSFKKEYGIARPSRRVTRAE
ncbi:MAG: hypothetical protein JRJ12_09670 [Deltaproteobacteria bacterium]|nr:hypothetical protein [Deltaproteobacteria bacterium]MBW2071748.1 hypothetical protein [Deltaproteobacteria bacterium]